jgi:aryl-alcohol dehydrogenase-like predicted oxidoreductase
MAENCDGSGGTMAIEKRKFGRTGHMSSAVIFGAAALGWVDQATADRTFELLFEYGINHIDTAPSYGDSEVRIGPWMDRHRDRFFLATKTAERGYQGARDEIHQSLERLRTDRIDLLQLHALTHPDEWDRALSPGGALEAAVEAREQGLVRHIGVTGHGWSVAAMHRRSLERFDFASVLMPAAPGRRARSPTPRPGTSHWKTRRTSGVPCSGCWRNPACS